MLLVMGKNIGQLLCPSDSLVSETLVETDMRCIKNEYHTDDIAVYVAGVVRDQYSREAVKMYENYYAYYSYCVLAETLAERSPCARGSAEIQRLSRARYERIRYVRGDDNPYGFLSRCYPHKSVKHYYTRDSTC